nr:transposase [Thauera propionica]
MRPSNRLRKAQARVAKIHQGIARQRADFLHKLSTQIAREHAFVCLEALRVRSMSASAAATQEAPGKRVRQKAGLNRAILDQGWSLFTEPLAYKLEWRGGELVLVHPACTSQRCHACAHTHADNRKGEVFRCRSFGYTDHANLNAAKNTLAAGHAVLAGDGQALVEGQLQSGRPVKREPTEGLRHAA